MDNFSGNTWFWQHAVNKGEVHMIEAMEKLLEWGGMKRDISFLFISAIAVLISLFVPVDWPVDPAWIAIVLCGIYHYGSHYWFGY